MVLPSPVTIKRAAAGILLPMVGQETDSRSRRWGGPLARWIAVAVLGLLALPGRAEDRGEANLNEPLDRDWYFFVAAVNVYPALESEDLIHGVLEPVLRGLSPGHPGVYTVGDLRDDHGLWPPHVGVGVNLSRRWSAFFEAGYTEGKLRTLLDRPSIVGLPLHTDFELKRGALFGGLGLDFYPWGMPEQREYDGFRDRLAGTRPFMGTRLTWTYATYRVKVKMGLKPLPNFVNLELSDAWCLPSATYVAGVEFPLSRDTTLSMSAGYNQFWDREFDFEGFAFTVQWKTYFGAPGRDDTAKGRAKL